MRRPLPIWLLLLPLLVSGCVTHKLWSESTLDEWNGPAGIPHLRLFRDEKPDDLLVVYEEYSDRHCTTNTRAFFLRQNLKPLARHVRPHFVSPDISRQLAPLPVFPVAPADPPGGLYAVMATNNAGFTIYSGQRGLGAHPLPNYNDGVGRVERIAWTPLTVTADLTIVGGMVALIVWDGMAKNPFDPNH